MTLEIDCFTTRVKKAKKMNDEKETVKWEKGKKMEKRWLRKWKRRENTIFIFFFSLVSAYICSFVSCMNHYFLQVPSGVEEVKKKTDWMQFNNTQNYYVIHVQFFKKNNDQILTQFHQTSQYMCYVSNMEAHIHTLKNSVQFNQSWHITARDKIWPVSCHA